MPTAEESKKANIAKMGEELGMHYSALWQEIAAIFANWKEFMELFGTNQKRVEMMNKAASSFFWLIQSELWKMSLLHIARLTDAPKSAGKRNLTLKALPDLIVDQTVKTKVEALLKQIEDKSGFCRDWRNRFIAHTDLDIAINEEPAKPLKTGTREDVTNLLKQMEAVLNIVSAHYLDTQNYFAAGGRLAGAVSLLECMYHGTKALDEREERFGKGEFREGDFDKPDW